MKHKSEVVNRAELRRAFVMDAVKVGKGCCSNALKRGRQDLI